VNLFVTFSFFVLGAVLGSFLNVVIYRLGADRGVLGRSCCLSCGHRLSWAELLPVVSFIFLGGRCRNCRSRISRQYPAVEFLTGVLFAGVFLKFAGQFPSADFLAGDFRPAISGLLAVFYQLAVFSVLIVIAVYDIRHKIIPDSFVLGFAGLAFLNLFFSYRMSEFFGPPFLDRLLAGPAIALPFFLIWLFSAGRWMGLGDAKLSVGIGWFLGFSAALSAVAIGFWLGAVVGLSVVFAGRFLPPAKQLGMKSEIPLGPFLIAGLIIVFFFNLNVFGF
jgi:leader peptidase (prepilin peptidase)/N-methyltransferase